MNAAPDLVTIFDKLDLEVYHVFQILDRIFTDKINKHSSYFSLEKPFASDFKVIIFENIKVLFIFLGLVSTTFNRGIEKMEKLICQGKSIS